MALSHSRPSTPIGRLSPRGSFNNISDAAEPGSPLLGGSPGREAKDRLKSLIDAESQASLLRTEEKDQLDRAKKEEPALPAGRPIFPIMSYCFASIAMTCTNKYVVSGQDFNMNLLLLTLQSAFCIVAVWLVKRIGLITFRDFDRNDAKMWFPVSFLLVLVIYTGSKALQFLSIPVYTIFKNLTIILIAYGEVFWFGGRVTGLTLVSFFLMIGSSVIAAWSDIYTAVTNYRIGIAMVDPTSGADIPVVPAAGGLNAGYLWMALNCIASAGYVLYMRKRIKTTGFKDWDSMFYNNFLSIPVLLAFSLLIENWSIGNLQRNFPENGRTVLMVAIAFSGAVAVFISYSTAWCVRICGSTTYSMVGALNKLPVAASGILFFGDPANVGNVSAITVGGLAGIVYAVAKTNQARVEKVRSAKASADARS